MNIGIFLGSFNPPHIGHLQSVNTILSSSNVSKVIVVPAFRNPWKDKKVEDGVSPDQEFYLRYNLCKMMFKDLIMQHKVYVSDVEYHIWRLSHKYDDDTIYSYETIAAIKNMYLSNDIDWQHIVDAFDIDGTNDRSDGKYFTRCQFVITTTLETYVDIPDWKNGKSILANNNFIAIATEDMVKKNDFVGRSMPQNVPIIFIEGINIHSTMIRQWIKEGNDPYPFITQEMKELIKKEYKNLSL